MAVTRAGDGRVVPRGAIMRFGLLGLLQAEDGAGNALPVAGVRQRLLLAALLVRVNRVIPARELAEIVWDGAPPAAAAALRTQVMRLRRALGPNAAARITARDPGYVITLSAEELDVTLFEALHRQAGAAMQAGRWGEAACVLDPALALWRGAALLDVESRALRDECGERVEQLRVQAIEWQVEAGMHMGRHEQLVPQLRDLARQHPLREHNHAQLMLALYRCGRQGEALAAYQRARTVLVTELGVEPGPVLRELHQRILAADPALAVTGPALPAEPEPQQVTPQELPPTIAAIAEVPHQLPMAVRYFAGRASELKTLDGILAEAVSAPGMVVIYAIGGTAGVGKTALAVHWAHQVADRFSDGQLYVNLRGFGPADVPVAPAEAIRGFLDALGVRPERIPAALDAQAGLFRSLLAGKKMLIVLDNAHDEQQVRPLLPASPGCLVLVTSRRQLAGLAATDGARLLTLNLLSHAEARQMLTLRVGPDHAAEPDAMDQIASLCARLPLALAVASARAHARPQFSLAMLAAELSSVAGRLDALDAGDPAASVRAVFSWSYQQLSPEAARMFRLLGLHPGPSITTPAAASLAATTPPAAGQALRELTAANLLTEHPPGRYAFHDLLRAYAAELAHAVDDEQARKRATEQMLDHYLQTADAAALFLKPTREPVTLTPPRPGVTPEFLAGHQEAQDWFEAERRVLLAALAIAAESGFDAFTWQLPLAMSDFLERRGYWHESVAIQRTALDAATRLGDIAGRAMVGRVLGKACVGLADYDQACVHMTDSLELYRKLGDLDGQARVHQSLAWAAGRSGQHRDALGHAEQALDLFQAIGNRSGQAAALNALGYGHAMLGDPQRARPFCRQALALNQELGLHRGETAHAWDSLGYVENQLGHHRDAVECYQSALRLFRDLGDRFNEAEILTHLGDALHLAGDQQEAGAAWKQALVILDDLHHPDAEQIRAKLRSG